MSDMKFLRRDAAKTAGILLGGTLLAGVTSYFMTKFLVSTAMDRKGPKVLEKVGSLISGTMQSEGIIKAQKEASEKLLSTEMETVSILSHDGIDLVGHWYPCDRPERIVIAMHGWRSSWTNDFGLVADFMHDNRCGVLFVEQRGQNESGGDYIGFGITERFDCLDWIDWVINTVSDELPIYLCGVSMGATTVLMAGGLELPENVHGIIADCGFTSPDEIWRHIANDNLHISYRFRRQLLRNLFDKHNRISGFDYSTIEALRECVTPVLFIHGTDDHFVPVEMTYRNYCACAAPKRLLVVPGADHGMSYPMDTEGYQNVVRNFWKEFDGGAPEKS